MEEVRLFLDFEKKKEISDTIEFEPVKAGEIIKKKVYILNIIEFPISVKFGLVGENIKIINQTSRISPGQTGEIEFELDPKITLVKPITAKLNVMIEYVIR